MGTRRNLGMQKDPHRHCRCQTYEDIGLYWGTGGTCSPLRPGSRTHVYGQEDRYVDRERVAFCDGIRRGEGV